MGQIPRCLNTITFMHFIFCFIYWGRTYKSWYLLVIIEEILCGIVIVEGAKLTGICLLPGWSMVAVGRRMGGVCGHRLPGSHSIGVHPSSPAR